MPHGNIKGPLCFLHSKTIALGEMNPFRQGNAPGAIADVGCPCRGRTSLGLCLAATRRAEVGLEQGPAFGRNQADPQVVDINPLLGFAPTGGFLVPFNQIQGLRFMVVLVRTDPEFFLGDPSLPFKINRPTLLIKKGGHKAQGPGVHRAIQGNRLCRNGFMFNVLGVINQGHHGQQGPQDESQHRKAQKGSHETKRCTAQKAYGENPHQHQGTNQYQSQGEPTHTPRKR